MTATEETFLPKPELDLPKPELDLPKEPEELPSHATPTSSEPARHQRPHTARHTQHDVRTLLSWQAPGRPFRKRKKEYFVNTLLLTLLVLIILFLFSQYLLMMVVISLVFVSFALAITPPHPFQYKISTEGITIEDHFFLWQELYDFYFKRREGIDILILRTKSFLPGELVITLGDMHKEHIKSVLLPYLPYREIVTPTFMEKSGDWLAKTFPLETNPHQV